MSILLAYGLSILLFIMIALWIIIPALYGLPRDPTNTERIRKALKLVRLRPQEVFYDLGAGDGRVLFIAAREFGAKATGIEVGPMQCALIWLRAAASGFGDQIRVRWENFYKTDLQDADVVFVYATSKEALKLAPHLERQLKNGARLVSIAADFPGWEPSVFDEHALIFVYEMPPVEGSISSYWLKKAIQAGEK
jgi:SAM-dependent methyltransferase